MLRRHLGDTRDEARCSQCCSGCSGPVLFLISRDKLAGYLMLVPWLVFATTMGSAIIGMMIAMQLEDLTAPIALPIVIVITVVTCLYYTNQVIKSCAS